jgi:hypothetical protein
MSNGTVQRSDQANVNVTLEPAGSQGNPLFGKKYPCCLCGNGLEIRVTRKSKPYTTCLGCGIQTFFRAKTGIKRLMEIVSSNILITGKGSQTELAVILFNRIQQLRAQKKELEQTQGLIIRDPDLENAIRAVDNEIKRVQGELAKLGRKTNSEKSK